MDEHDPIGPVNALGEELRAWRHKAGMRLEDFAPKLHLSHQMIGAIERGTRAATRKTADLCDEVFDTPGTFLRLWKRDARLAMPSNVSPYFDLQTEATRIHQWELRCVPGLLQTEAYARAILRTDLARRDEKVLAQDVKMRIERQNVLTKKNPPLAWFIIDESVLHRHYGDMQEQLSHLIMAAQLPNVVIQVLPYSMNDHPGLNGPLTILEFADSPPMAYAQGWGSGRLIETPADVATFIACYDLIRASALSRDTSLAMIKHLMESRNGVG